MNENIKKICQMEDATKQYKIIDYLLDNDLVSIEVFDKYYRENLTYRSLCFFIRYSDIRYTSKGKGINVKLDEDAVIKSKDFNFIYYFWRVVGANKSRLEDAIIETGDICGMINFCKNNEVNLSKFEDYIYKNGTISDMLHFNRRVHKANIAKLEDTVIKTGDCNAIYECAKIEGADQKKLLKELVKFKRAGYIVNIISNYINCENAEETIKEVLAKADINCLNVLLREVNARKEHFLPSMTRNILERILIQMLEEFKEPITIEEFIENIDEASDLYSLEEIRNLFTEEPLTKVKKL